jgi:Telomerase activating protein Est1
MQHPSFGSLVSCKEIEEKLWKFCFYVKIEEYRKSIRKTVSLRDGQEGPDATPAAVSLALKARAHLAKLISAFTKFLSDGTSFYQEFMMKASLR